MWSGRNRFLFNLGLFAPSFYRTSTDNVTKRFFNLKRCRLSQAKTGPKSDIGGSVNNNINNNGSEKKLSLFARFKAMYRDYWYVLVPVHVVTSCGWFGGFYQLSKR